MSRILCALIVLTIIVSPVFAGQLNLMGRAGIYTPPVAGAAPSIMYGVGAEYDMTENFTVRAAADTTSYSDGTNNYTLTPVTLDLIYRQTIQGMLTPYVGAGIGYYASSVNGATSSTTGLQTEAGVKFALGGFNAGFEIRYLLPDTADASSGAFSTNGYATGQFMQSFNI
jgi:opacity protein-like surface antigen